jgi:hypothetical protein
MSTVHDVEKANRVNGTNPVVTPSTGPGLSQSSSDAHDHGLYNNPTLINRAITRMSLSFLHHSEAGNRSVYGASVDS